MGKRIIQQARGKGSLTYRVKKKAFRFRIRYPTSSGEAQILRVFHSPAHSAPLIKVQVDNEIFYNAAFDGAHEGQKITIGSPVEVGNIIMIKDAPIGTRVFNVERWPHDGGKMMRSAGSAATVSKKLDNKKVIVVMPNKKEVVLNENCRATVGVIAGDGRILKPFMTAGKKYYKKKAKSKLWPRVSAVKMNAVDHPFGSGRGKRIKSKIAKRNAPPGRKVGHIRPSKTGKKR